MEDKMITSYILRKNERNKQQMILQACIKFSDLKDRVQYGYRVNPSENPYATNIFGDPNQHYQRRIDPGRISKIKDYIKNSILKSRDNNAIAVLFPTALLLAFDYDDDLPDAQKDIFDIHLPYNFYIVDGQHRLRSMQVLYDSMYGREDEDSMYIKRYLDNYVFNCTLLMNFDMWEQAQVFADVNFTQKAVSKSLYYDIYGMEYYDDINDRTKSAMYIAHQIIDELNSNPTSAMHGFIKMLGYGQGYVSQSCLADAIIPSMTSPQGVWYIDFDSYRDKEVPPYKHIATEIMTFFKAISETFPALWPKVGKKAPSILCKTTGIQALVKLIGYLHYHNRDLVERIIPINTQFITINKEYKEFVIKYLRLFEKSQKELFGLKDDGGLYSGTGGKGLAIRLYTRLIEIIEEKETMPFQAWLNKYLDSKDYDDVFCLYEAVVNVDRYGMYDASYDGEIIIVYCDMDRSTPLKLKSSLEQKRFLNYLDDKYGGEIGVEAMYSFKRAMEKDD